MNLQTAANLAYRIKNFVYNTQDLLGKGAAGKVYKGKNQLNGQQVAIKIMEMSQIDNEVTQYLLLCQKEALLSLKNQYVLHAYDIIQTPQQCLIVTPLCDGGTLKSYITSKGKLSEIEALQIFYKLLKGSIEIRNKGFIHRDLKSINVMFKNNEPLIIDFGYCEKVTGKKPKMFYNVGSPSYMSPEAYYKSAYSEKSDIWALGVVLFQMLEGFTIDHGQQIDRYFSSLCKYGFNLRSKVSESTKHLLRAILNPNFQQRPNLDQIIHITQRIVNFEYANNPYRAEALKNQRFQMQQKQQNQKKISLKQRAAEKRSKTQQNVQVNQQVLQGATTEENKIHNNTQQINKSKIEKQQQEKDKAIKQGQHIQQKIKDIHDQNLVKMSESIIRPEKSINQSIDPRYANIPTQPPKAPQQYLQQNQYVQHQHKYPLQQFPNQSVHKQQIHMQSFQQQSTQFQQQFQQVTHHQQQFHHFQQVQQYQNPPADLPPRQYIININGVKHRHQVYPQQNIKRSQSFQPHNNYQFPPQHPHINHSQFIQQAPNPHNYNFLPGQKGTKNSQIINPNHNMYFDQNSLKQMPQYKSFIENPSPTVTANENYYKSMKANSQALLLNDAHSALTIQNMSNGNLTNSIHSNYNNQTNMGGGGYTFLPKNNPVVQSLIVEPHKQFAINTGNQANINKSVQFNPNMNVHNSLIFPHQYQNKHLQPNNASNNNRYLNNVQEKSAINNQNHFYPSNNPQINNEIYSNNMSLRSPIQNIFNKLNIPQNKTSTLFSSSRPLSPVATQRLSMGVNDHLENNIQRNENIGQEKNFFKKAAPYFHMNPNQNHEVTFVQKTVYQMKRPTTNAHNYNYQILQNQQNFMHPTQYIQAPIRHQAPVLRNRFTHTARNNQFYGGFY